MALEIGPYVGPLVSTLGSHDQASSTLHNIIQPCGSILLTME